jgi:hypothetical protein
MANRECCGGLYSKVPRFGRAKDFKQNWGTAIGVFRYRETWHDLGPESCRKKRGGRQSLAQCLEIQLDSIPFGIYSMPNSGIIKTRTSNPSEGGESVTKFDSKNFHSNHNHSTNKFYESNK